MAAHVAYTDVSSSSAVASEEPRSLREPTDDEIWPLSLSEAIRLAMCNNRMVLVNSEFLSDASRLLRNPEALPSVYDQAIQDSGVLTGSRGMAAALSDFDPRFSSSMTWGRDENIQNNLFLSGGLQPGDTLVEDRANFDARLEKIFSNGGQVAVTHDWDYSSNNSTARLFPSAYDGGVGLEYRQPLWAGAGTEFTRIAGPVSRVNQGSTGVSQGIVIARINHDISIDDFEIDVRKHLYDVVNAYWDLYLANQEYEVERDVRDRTKETWEQVKAKLSTGVTGGGAADEAQANEEYLASRSRTELSLATVWEVEARLRRLLGLPANDGRLIQPADAPTKQAVAVDWHQLLCNAMVMRNELRKQKSMIRSLELQLTAAGSLVNPRLDFVSGYKVNGFGDRLTEQSDDTRATGQARRSAYGNIFGNDQTGWELGLVMSVPLGLRSERSQVRNLQYRLAKARTALCTQEREISHELAHAFNSLDRWFTTSGTNSERRVAADRRVNAFEAEYANGRTSLDAMLRARISQAQSRIEYLRSLTEYNKAIAAVHFRSGTLPDVCSVQLADRQSEPPPLDLDTTAFSTTGESEERETSRKLTDVAPDAESPS